MTHTSFDKQHPQRHACKCKHVTPSAILELPAAFRQIQTKKNILPAHAEGGMQTNNRVKKDWQLQFTDLSFATSTWE
jgi:hypothetical protein